VNMKHQSNNFSKRGLFSRVASHLWFEVRGLASVFNDQALRRIEKAVAASESEHSAELRIAIESSMPLRVLWFGASPRARATDAFARHRIWDTEANNGVLIYICIADRAVEIVADRGITAHLPKAYWENVCAMMVSGFAKGEFEQATIKAIEQLESDLIRLYPVTSGQANPNELSNRPLIL
jgi:uncharacterized membrane protein